MEEEIEKLVSELRRCLLNKASSSRLLKHAFEQDKQSNTDLMHAREAVRMFKIVDGFLEEK